MGANGIASPFIFNSLNSSSFAVAGIGEQKLSNRLTVGDSQAKTNLEIGRLKLAEGVYRGSRITTGASLNISDTSSPIHIDSINNLSNTNSSQDAIKGIRVEISREDQINSIEQESQRVFSKNTSGKDLIKYLQDLKDAREKITEWKGKGGLEREIKTGEKSISEIGVWGKRSLQELYLIHAKLQESTNSLLLKLRDTSLDNGDSIKNSLIKMKHQWRDVRRALKWINWKKKYLKIRVKYLDEAGRIVFNPDQKGEEKTYGWGNWKQNPFRVFFNSRQEYKAVMDKLERAERSLKNFQAGQGMMGKLGENVVNAKRIEKIKRHENSFKVAVSEAILDLEMQVASKLVEWIKPE